MEHLEEISKTVQDMAELQLQQEKRLVEVENRKVQLPDYGPVLKAILKQVETNGSQASDNTAVNGLSEKVGQLNAKMPDRWRIIHLHDFSPGSTGFIIGGFLLLLAFAAALAIAINLRQRNSELSAHSVRYRLVRQYYPNAATWTERKYARAPDSARMEVERLEAEQEALRLAEDAARKKEAELLEARERAEGLRRGRKHNRGTE
ncbi:hypothetical protein ACFOET_01405 [Parapedobacter deserti]|uniref:Uncharacterized protein n=1 Tax=Parapedobacter deserti TaxID=1912957 RepID=A0ABV7JHC6_9SPHI